MQRTPDGSEVVATADDVDPALPSPLLVVESVEQYLNEHGIGAGPMSWQRIGDGQSNITYLIQRGDDRVVLRRGPRPPIPRSTHDMVREARIQRAVATAGFPVPEILAVNEDDALLGVPFYVMSYLDGVVVTDDVPDHLDDTESRKRTSLALIDTLADLHSIDVTSGDLATLGRPDGYLRRQVERFGALWDDMAVRSIPEIEQTREWLARNMPDSPRAALVHGDYRLGNLMFAETSPATVRAVLDWEMATLGDPLADLGYLTATYSDASSTPTPLHMSPITALPGYLSSAELVRRYTDRTGTDASALGWYEALALWKAAIFSEAIYLRWRRGERPADTFGPSLERGVPELARAALASAERR